MAGKLHNEGDINMTIRTTDNLAQEHKALKYIIEHLSQQNKTEVALCYPYYSADEVITATAERTQHGFILFAENGDPAGVGGILPQGRIWFVITEEAAKQLRISWFKNTRKWLDKMHEENHRIEGYSWVKNTLSHQWMRFMGFEFCNENSPATQEIAGEKFLYFMRTK